MRRGLAIAELVRQDVLDLDPEPLRPPCLIPPRLLRARLRAWVTP